MEKKIKASNLLKYLFYCLVVIFESVRKAV